MQKRQEKEDTKKKFDEKTIKFILISLHNNNNEANESEFEGKKEVIKSFSYARKCFLFFPLIFMRIALCHDSHATTTKESLEISTARV